MSERAEALLRIVIGIVSGFILGIWKMIIQLLTLVHWIIVIIIGQRNKSIAEFCEMWNTQIYVYLRYITFVLNKRPFPFDDLKKNLSKFK